MRGCVGAWVRGCVGACARACMCVRGCVGAWVRGCVCVRARVHVSACVYVCVRERGREGERERDAWDAGSTHVPRHIAQPVHPVVREELSGGRQVCCELLLSIGTYCGAVRCSPWGACVNAAVLRGWEGGGCVRVVCGVNPHRELSDQPAYLRHRREDVASCLQPAANVVLMTKSICV